jgi:uncharacterized protein YoxC
MYIVISLSSIVFVAAFVWIAINLIDTLKSVKRLAESVESTAKDIESVKDTFKVGALGIVSAVLGKLRGGDKNDR